jgi:hypothetical protein
MARLYLTSLIPMYFAFLLIPAEASVWPSVPVLAIPNNFAYLFVAYTAVVLGGILQLYNLADRGFSLRILIDLLKTGPTTDVDAVISSYSGGRGIEWMLQKRLDDLVANRLIVVRDDNVNLTRRGKILARLYKWLRKLYGFR